MASGRADTIGRIGSFLSGLFTGLLVGVTIGLLCAPCRGAVMRHRLRRRMEEMCDPVDEAVQGLRGEP